MTKELTRPDYCFSITCDRCKKPVECIQVEDVIDQDRLTWQWFRTGEIIVTVKCHGATWKVSNRRGVVEETFTSWDI